MAYKLDLEAFHRILSFRARSCAPLDGALVRWIDFSTGHGFHHIFRNEVGAEVGYMIWAQFNDETVGRLLNRRQFPLYRHEWDEGIVNFILDIFYANGRYRLERSRIEAALPPDVDKVAYVHRNRLNLIRRMSGSLIRVGPDRFLTAANEIPGATPLGRPD